MIEFVGFPKIGRLKRNVVITEKIDGTNAGIQITHISKTDLPITVDTLNSHLMVDGYIITAQSRNRIISTRPADDNYGFARWVKDNAGELIQLGEGVHFGEWWGEGIQCGYGIKGKRFSLFNTGRWKDNPDLPSCCHVVPILYSGDFSTDAVEDAMKDLATQGSRASPGFMRPEGVIVYHTAVRTYFKRTFEHDESGKESV